MRKAVKNCQCVTSIAIDAVQRWTKGIKMRLTRTESKICDEYMKKDANGKVRCYECPLNLTAIFKEPECYATVDGRGLSLKRYKDNPKEFGELIRGSRGIAKYIGMGYKQFIRDRDLIGVPYFVEKSVMHAYAAELDAWKEEYYESV